MGTPRTMQEKATGVWNDGPRLLVLVGVALVVGPAALIMAAGADPSLMGYWKFDGDMLDSSGNNRSGTFMGYPTHGTFAPGVEGQALNLDGWWGHVRIEGYTGIAGGNPFTITAWVNTTTAKDETIVCWGTNAGGQRVDFRLYQGRLRVEHGNGNLQGNTALNDGNWHHVACVVGPNASIQSPDVLLYLDGRNDSRTTTSASKFNIVPNVPVTIGQLRTTNWRAFRGLIDEVRIYNRVLTAQEIDQVMRAGPAHAWGPHPANGATTSVGTATPLTWAKSDKAVAHHVYLGTDQAAVAAAGSTDVTGTYRGLVATTSYTPPGGLDLGRMYFWRVDEVDTEGNLVPGAVWRFRVDDYVVVDDFESYSDVPGQTILDTWIDGWTNGTCSASGYPFPPHAERDVVHSGEQAMPLIYNNTMAPYYSEVERRFATAQDWTANGVTDLITWFRGMPASFAESPEGRITVTAQGTDIWNTSDSYRLVYKQLNGNGSIVAKVESLINTDPWAKAGVMIRQSLADDSAFVYMVQSYSNGVSLGWRPTARSTCSHATQAGVVAPQWVKLTRTGNVFTARYSSDGTIWTDLKNADGTVASTTVAMTDPVYVGLAVTSHNGIAVTTAEFSSVVMAGAVSGQWQYTQRGGWQGNWPAGWYIAIEDSSGRRATVDHPDGNAVLTPTWTEWRIPLKSFTGVDLRSVSKLYLGAGDGKTKAGNWSVLGIDDIRLGHSLSPQ